jgi:hypothetical protein
MTIDTAEEFVRLRSSEDPEEYRRAAHEEAPLAVWLDVIARFPEMRFWVAQNKTVPLEILSQLAGDDDPKVRSMVAMKRKATAEIIARLVDDPDFSVRMQAARHRNAPPPAIRCELHADAVQVDPEPEDVMAAIELLDGRWRSFLELRAAGAEGPALHVAGGNDGRFVVVHLDAEAMPSVLLGDPDAEGEVMAVADGQESGFEARQVVGLESATEAALAFMRDGAAWRGGVWETA